MSQLSSSIENSFIAGLKTEFTGLNFPAHAATDTDNCIYDLVGDVYRREGFDFEENFSVANIDRSGKAIATYKWNNVGGDGLTQIIVSQVGNILYFYRSSSATDANPLSNQLLVSTVDISQFRPAGSVVLSSSTECQFTAGNGYLFVFHPNLDPFYCIYNAGTQAITGYVIDVKIRDFLGIPENIPDDFRPSSLSNEHLYNLRNQGWGSAANWTANSTTTNDANTGVHTWIVQPGLPIIVAQSVSIQASKDISGIFVGKLYESGLVVAYNNVTGSLSINVNSSSLSGTSGWNNWIFIANTQDRIGNWHTAIGNYPSNSDIWWRFKDSTGAFNPTGTINNVTISTGPAPKGSYIISAFNQDRSAISGVSGLTPITTSIRPKIGTWFQGRVWYAGVDANQVATGDAPFYSWSENIYFSQIVVSEKDFQKCYQTNDPTDENLFDLLPSDGGVITIQSCGSIYKLFPIQNGMLVFAANGIWFITGSQGIGFTANDYTVTQISQIQSISPTSFVNVQGLPYFWNEEGIYSVVPAQQGLGLTVEPLTVGTILSFYNEIPIQSKKYVRGDYNPIDYVIQWCFRSTNETGNIDRYNFDRVLSFNTYNKAFYPYTISNSAAGNYIHSVNYVAGPGGSSSPSPTFKYFCSIPSGGTYFVTFADEHDDGYRDWRSNGSGGSNFVSYFVTGYRLAGQALKKFQPVYVQMYSRLNGEAGGYKIQGIWDYANDPNSGKYTTIQRIINGLTRFGIVYRRHRIRGHGMSLQIKVISVDGLPFDIIGWSSLEATNSSV